MLRVKYLLISVAALALVFVQNLQAGESLDETIKFLLNHIATADAEFVRNGSSHTPAEAREHVNAKYEHFKDQIKTPEDFIRLSASKSLLTGKPYLVKPKGGKEQTLSNWLTEALREHRAGKSQSAG